MGTVLLSIRPGMFWRELALLQRLGQVERESAGMVRGELEGYAYENQRDKSFRTETLGLRLSRRRFLVVMRNTFEAERGAATSLPGPAMKSGAGPQ